MKKLVLTFGAVCAAYSLFAMLDDAEATRVAKEVFAQMTLEEKCQLLGGSGTFTIAAFPRLGIEKEWTFADNSSTVRPSRERWSWNRSQPETENTKLPSLSALAQTWDRQLARVHGEVLGAECRDRGVDCILGPGVNIMRTPLCGRNWEYFGEDPCLTSKMCVPMIRGVQSYDVAAMVKHFCLNNQELARTEVNTHCDARTLNEIYLPAFQAAITKGKVLGVMSSYNKIDDIWASENKYLQQGILRDRFGFKGMLSSDWGGQHSTEFAVNSSTGLDMSRGDAIRFNYYAISNRYPLAEAVRANKVPEATVDELAFHTLWAMAKTGMVNNAPRKTGARNTREHQLMARIEGAESIVLLKNEKKILPLNPENYKKVLVIGKNAAEKQCHKGCSAEGKVPYEITLFDALKARLKDAEVKILPYCAKMIVEETDVSREVSRAGGGNAEMKEYEPYTEEDVLKLEAETSDAVIVFAGTEIGYQENMECEGRDRVSMDWPKELNEAMEKILKWKVRNLVVVSRSGSPVGYTWVDDCDTLLQTSYLGMEEGNSICDVLFGNTTPSGKLCQTWPKRYEDTGVAQKGTYNATNVVYNERFYVGYRWFDKTGIKPLFPFGYGLSYTEFKFEGAHLSKSAEGDYFVTVKVKNVGRVIGKEVVQLYVAYPEAKVERCVKDLRGFAKTKLLNPGDTDEVVIKITPRDLAYWDTLSSRFHADAGKYQFLIGNSSVNILEKLEVTLDEDRDFTM